MAVAHLIDWNCKLLPYPNGNESIERCVEALSVLSAKFGFDTFCLTPEFDADRESVPSFLQRTKTAFNSLRSAVPDSIRLILRPIAVLTPGLSNVSQLVQLLVSNRYLSIRFPISTYRDWMDTELNRLLYVDHFSLLPTSFETAIYLFPDEILQKLMRIPNAVYEFDLRSLSDPSVETAVRRLQAKGITVLIGSGADSLKKAELIDFDLPTSPRSFLRRYAKPVTSASFLL